MIEVKYYLAGIGFFAAMVAIIVVECIYEKYLTLGVVSREDRHSKICFISFFMSECFEVSGTYIALNKQA